MNDRSHTVKDAPWQIIATGHIPLLRFATRYSTYCIRSPHQQPQRLTLLFKRRVKRGTHIARGAGQQYQRARLRLALLKPDNTAVLLQRRGPDPPHSRQLINVFKRAMRLPVLDYMMRLSKTHALQALRQYFCAGKVDVDRL